ncbi:hypothetical protein HpBGD38_14920 [Helicobacter pylori]|uniref:hypothetical protein n=1 Tax=Helicobacter pylori TaxID=210 RepID=UPI0036F37C2A
MLTDEKLKGLNTTPSIHLSFDSQKKTLTIKDNGIGLFPIHLSEPPRPAPISYARFRLEKKKKNNTKHSKDKEK